MDFLRKLAPWQIIAAAVGVLVLMLVGGYFLVSFLTTTPTAEKAQSDVPGDLDGKANTEVLEKLDVFEAPKDGLLAPQPVETVDPNSPSTVNPFQ
ncbi:MAG TPA: hypothetical protein VIF43_03815 [Patescibacteria group bacterium]|jgi:hypothetical protein